MMENNVENLPKYPRNIDEFEATKTYWEKLISGILKDSRANKWQVPWFTESKTQDGVPYLEDKYYRFFSAVNFEKRKGLEINQFEEMDFPGIAVWFDRFGDPDEPRAIERLIINTVLSKENEAIVIDLVQLYVIGDASKKEVQKLIERIGLRVQ